MGALTRAFDWSKTPIGPLASWPQSLRTAVRIVLASRYAMFIWWGPERINLYNDPYREFLGIKHPAALGKPAQEVWGEIWDQVGPRADAVLLRGESTFDEALLLLMERHGYREETYFTFSYSPLPDDADGIGGLFCAVKEETQQIIGERRLRLLRELAAATSECRTAAQVCQSAARCLCDARRDLPFSMLYLVEPDDERLKRIAESGIEPTHPAAPARVALHEDASAWPFRDVMETGEATLIEDLSTRFLDLPKGEWNEPPQRAMVMPIAQQGQKRPAGIFVAGLNPHRELDENFKGFLTLLSNQIAGAISNAVAYEAERRRAEELAELDRVKTQFFSNVSHEFRTPLTLMLGPLEDVVPEARERLSARGQESLITARRNALRLLKLVNTLLDFSRIEAGRMQAVYEPTDLASFTSEIASVFRPAMEKAGLRFSLDCEPLGEPIYVDRDMWEKIVLNLLSNAFKFTLEGQIVLSLRKLNDSVELTVGDSGVGIPEHELVHVFERFHRIESSQARSYEGTGIGLALVQELARLHGGSVRVESSPGRGTAFTVSVPTGVAHLPADRIQAARAQASTAVAGEAYVEEAQRWIPQDSSAANDVLPEISRSVVADGEAASSEKPLIVVADDNADMRDYIARLLRGEYRVHVASDGLHALEAARKLRPDLVLADVMMPRLDGFELLRSIRSDPAVGSVPVILLSARAGEEARVEGLHAGADDYLVKPFTTRELTARVATHLRMANVRREAATRESRLRVEAELERQRLTLAQQAAGIGSFELNLETNVNRWTPTLEAMHGLAPGGFGGTLQAWEELVHPDDRAEAVRQVELSLQTRAPVQAEWRVIWPDGSIHWLLARWQAISDESGKLVRLTGVNIDITEQKRAQEAQQRLSAIVASSDDAIISKDLSGIVTSWNAAAERMFGYTADEIIGGSIMTIIPPELYEDEDRILSTIARGEKIEHFETMRLHKNGTRVEVALTVSPVRDRSGKIIGSAKIARDITQTKRTERSLRTAERLASVGRLAATVAHEINNPLEAISNLVYLAKQTDSPEVARSYLEGAEEELDRIFHISKQTLGFYREVKGATAIRLSAIVTSLLSVFASRTRSKNIQVYPEVRGDTEVRGVPGELRQVVANLMSNSIDAVPSGGRIRIRVSKAWGANQTRSPGVRLTIADNGSGISPDILKHLFEPFVTSNKEIGTGLGLWITKTIVAAHGGTIRVKSSTKPGKSWTVFTIFLPAAASQTAAATAGEHPV